MNNLIQTVDKEPRVDSRDLAAAFNNNHRPLYRLLTKYQSDFEEFGKVCFQNSPSKSGQVQKYAYLNEDQCYLLLTFSRNTEQTIVLKKRLVREFKRLRRQIVKRGELAWQEARKAGKAERQRETAVIQQFVEYAEEQGSKNAARYYGNITTMTYKALGFIEQGLKVDGLRDRLQHHQLTILATAEIVAMAALQDGMRDGMPYKMIYILARDRVNAVALAVGSAPLLTVSEMQS